MEKFITIREYDKSMNTRPAIVTIYRPLAPDTGDPEEEDILYDGPLSDTMSPQRLNVNPKFDRSRPVDEVVLKFLPPNNPDGFYWGDKWPKDMVISEIEFWGY